MTRNLLFAEDQDVKYDAVQKILAEQLSDDWVITRARTLVEAENLLFEGHWDAYVLDMSLDLTAGRAAFGSPSQATLGGLQLIQTICLEGLERQTLIVTAFDAFSNAKTGKRADSIVDLHHVEAEARRVLGSFYVGCVRYGSANWSGELNVILRGIR
jgi:hypothetical protein